MEKTRLGELEEQIVLTPSGWKEIYAVSVASELARVTGGNVSPATSRVPSVGAEAGVRVR